MKRFIIILTAACLLASSCRVQLVSDYDSTAASRIDDASRMIDLFYLTLAETDSSDRQYASFKQGYVKIEVELISILNTNKARPLNKDSEKISENALKQWIKYKDKHKADNTIKDADIKLNRIYMDEHMLRLRLGEKFKPVSTGN